MWQDIIVYSILALGAGFTLWRFYAKFTAGGSCCGGGCTCKGPCAGGKPGKSRGAAGGKGNDSACSCAAIG